MCFVSVCDYLAGYALFINIILIVTEHFHCYRVEATEYSLSRLCNQCMLYAQIGYATGAWTHAPVLNMVHESQPCTKAPRDNNIAQRLQQSLSYVQGFPMLLA